MSVPKFLLFGAITLFVAIGVVSLFKKGSDRSNFSSDLKEAEPLKETAVVAVPSRGDILSSKIVEIQKEDSKKPDVEWVEAGVNSSKAIRDDFPTIDRIFQLFSLGMSKLPIVETITYTSSVPWLKGRPAWVSDYATYYHTSRHFIARSLNGKPDYFSQKIFEGSKFNVFRTDKKIQFYLLCDTSRLKMGFYYVDLDTNERVLLKTYPISVGRVDLSKPSGTLTPLGRYALGNRVAIYKPGVMGQVGDQSLEMVRTFGTRWIPLDREIERTTASSKGYGLYGVPWALDEKTGELVEQRHKIGQYDTDGGIRMLSEDLEELFSIVISKPTFVEIVKDFKEAKLPGVEVATPTR